MACEPCKKRKEKLVQTGNDLIATFKKTDVKTLIAIAAAGISVWAILRK